MEEINVQEPSHASLAVGAAAVAAVSSQIHALPSPVPRTLAVLLEMPLATLQTLFRTYVRCSVLEHAGLFKMREETSLGALVVDYAINTHVEGTEKDGHPEVIVPLGVFTFHTHPLSGYALYAISVAPPSSADMAAVLRRFLSDGILFHLVLAYEGIYTVSLSAAYMRWLRQVSLLEQELHVFVEVLQRIMNQWTQFQFCSMSPEQKEEIRVLKRLPVEIAAQAAKTQLPESYVRWAEALSGQDVQSYMEEQFQKVAVPAQVSQTLLGMLARLLASAAETRKQGVFRACFRGWHDLESSPSGRVQMEPHVDAKEWEAAVERPDFVAQESDVFEDEGQQRRT